MGDKTSWVDWAQIFLEEDIRDIITCFKFGDDQFRGLASAEGQILPFPIDSDGRPYNTLTLPCERAINYRTLNPQKKYLEKVSRKSILKILSYLVS